MAIEESLSLDLSPALAAIRGDLKREIEQIPSTLRAAFGDALQDMTRDVGAFAALARDEIDRVLGAPVTTTVDVDTSQVDAAAAEIDAAGQPIEAPVQVDTADLDAAVSEIDAAGEPIEAPVEVDTSQLDAAEEQIKALDNETITVGIEADSAGLEQAQSEVESLGAGFSKAGGSAHSLATEAAGAELGIKELSKGFGELGGSSLAAGLATGGFIAGIGLLAEEAINADAVTRSFDLRVGDLKETLERVDVAGFNTSLRDLARTVGANDEGLKLALARFVDLGRGSDFSREEIGKMGQELTALAATLSTTNPALGSADEILNRLPAVLARGGRALAPFGISLSANAIAAEALKENVGKTAEELTIFDRSAAGLTLTMQQLGPSLKANLDEGSKSATVQIRALKEQLRETAVTAGAPLVEPLTKDLKAIEPVLEASVKAFGSLATAVAGVLTPALEVVTPFLDDVATVLDKIPGPITAVGVAAVVTARHLQANAVAAEEAAAALTELAAAEGLKARASAIATGATEAEVAALEAEAVAATEAAGATATGLGAAVLPLTLIVGGGLLAANAIHSVWNNSKDLNKELEKVASGSKTAAAVIRELDKAMVFAGGSFERSSAGLKQFQQIATENVEAARLLRNELFAEGRDVSELNAILGEAGFGMADLTALTFTAADAIGSLGPGGLEAANAISRLTANFIGYNHTTDETIAANQALYQTYLDQIAVTKDAASVVNDLARAQHGSVDAEIAAIEAGGRLNEQIGKNAKELKDLREKRAKASGEEAAALDKEIARFGTSATTLDVWTEAGRANTKTINDLIDVNGKWLGQIFEQEGATANFNTTAKQMHDNLVIQLTDLGLSAEQIKVYTDKLDAIPRDITTKATFDVDLNLSPQFKALIASQNPLAGGLAVPFAQGGIIGPRYAAAGLEQQPGVFAGGPVRFAEPETQGEAFIPFAMDRRERATGILKDVAQKFGFELTPVGQRAPLTVASSAPIAQPVARDGGSTAVLERIASLLEKLPDRIPAGVAANVVVSPQEQDALSVFGERLRRG